LIPAQYSQAAAYGGEASTLSDYLPFGTYMFLHGGWLHLILNACGGAAAVTHVVFNAASTVPVLGASGAIAGVLGCYTRLFPFARLVVVIPILFFPFFFKVPAFVFTVLWFRMQMIQGTGELLMPSAGGGIAWWSMSAASLPASCSHRSYGSPRGAIAHITRTKAFSDSTPADAAERSHAGGRHHDFHRSFLDFLYAIGAAAGAATEHAAGDAHAQNRAAGEKA